MADLPETPITREEKYLSAISGQSSTDDLPERAITRKEQYLDYIARNGTGGGEGGTTNYNALTNKPSIGGVILTGDKSLEELGAASAADVAANSALLVDNENRGYLGKNLYNSTLEIGGISGTGGDNVNNRRCRTPLNQKIVLVASQVIVSAVNLSDVIVWEYDDIDSIIGTPIEGNEWKTLPYTFIPHPDKYYRYILKNANDSTIDISAVFVQTEIGDNATDYVPYIPSNAVLQEQIEQLKEQINTLRALHGLDPVEYSSTASLQSFTPKLTADVMDEPLSVEDAKSDIDGNTELTKNEPIEAELTVEKEPLTAHETELTDGLSVDDAAEPNAEDGETV